MTETLAPVMVGFTGTQSGMTGMQKTALTEMANSYIGSALKDSILNGKRRGVNAFHGDCVGADSDFHDIMRAVGLETITAIIAMDIGVTPVGTDRGVYIEVYPGCDRDGKSPKSAWRHADWRWPPEWYLDRNKKIVSRSDIVFATPREFVEQPRGGTWSTIRYAWSNNKTCVVILPDGKVATTAAEVVSGGYNAIAWL